MVPPQQLSGTQARADTAGSTSTMATPPPTVQTPVAAPTQTAKAWHGQGWPGP